MARGPAGRYMGPALPDCDKRSVYTWMMYRLFLRGFTNRKGQMLRLIDILPWQLLTSLFLFGVCQFYG